MKALTIKHSEITRESLLMMAEDIRGAWIGIRIAACLLFLSGWKGLKMECEQEGHRSLTMPWKRG